MTALFGPAALAILAYMTAAFAVSVVRRDMSVVDVAWGPGFVLVALAGLASAGTAGPRQVLAVALVTVWAVRLAGHVFGRNRGRGEDYRYAAMRERWGRAAVPRSFVQVFLLQGLFMFVTALPVLAILASPQRRLGPLDLAGTAVWALGFAFEAVGDAQLARFKRDPGNRGRVMTTGLWRFTRHPNYFGEAAMWWGLGLAALSGPGAAPALAGPVAITLLLRFVSGVPLVERKAMRKPEYREYAKRTSVFVPRRPKKG